jgi:hypothetical protein
MNTTTSTTHMVSSTGKCRSNFIFHLVDPACLWVDEAKLSQPNSSSAESKLRLHFAPILAGSKSEAPMTIFELSNGIGAQT